MKQRQRIQFAVGTVLLLAVAGGWQTAHRHSPASAANAPNSTPAAVQTPSGTPLGVTLVSVGVGSRQSVLKAPGIVSVPSSQTATVTPRVQGQVVEVAARVGSRVWAGEVLARIRSLDIATAQAAYDQATSQVHFADLALRHQRQLARLGSFTQKPVEDARAAVTQAQSTLLSDQNVYQQDLLNVQQDQAAVQQDETTQRQDEADESHDRIANEREEKLYSEGLDALQDVESSRTTLRKDAEKVHGDQLKAQQDQLKAQADQTKVAGDQSRVRADEMQLRITQEALNREQRAYSSNIYAAQAVEQAESAYNQALEQLQQARNTLRIHGVQRGSRGLVDVTAPLSGVVTLRNVNPGMNVDTSTETPWQMFTISNIDVVDVYASVYGDDIARVQVGMPVTVRSSALPGRVFEGRVTYIPPAIDPQSHSLRVKCQVANPTHILKDGMYVDTVIDTSTARQTLTVPTTAVQHDGATAYVFAPSGKQFVRRTVVTGEEKDGYTEVLSGLKPGERIVGDGAILLATNRGTGDD